MVPAATFPSIQNTSSSPPVARPASGTAVSQVPTYFKDVYEKSPSAPALLVGDTRLPRCSLGDLQPGDVGFQYQPVGRNFRQFWIAVGGHLANRWRPVHSDASVVHAFIVVKAHPEKKQLHTADGAGGNYRDIDEVRMDFHGGGPGTHVVPQAKYFFYRPTDPEMAKRMVAIARNWTSPGHHNFSIRRAAVSPFHSIKMRAHDRRDALTLLAQADVHAPPTKANSPKLFNMMCSEFVACVCQAATLSAWRQSHPQAQASAEVLRGLTEGPMDDLFAIDCEGATPPFLQAAFERSARWKPVGYVTDNG